ncbi:hypothetical protein FB45DRAFT_337545 [Roridomyces roridus]|uniref:Uncharacterized protein n=1 Tax=Roridomyces roridus TaxID=1738132 RepID=A0AAD7F9C6_9AGAR|nr:hypothetical protein FB45DRAFT_337545 [Roridomyces roridus]
MLRCPGGWSSVPCAPLYGAVPFADEAVAFSGRPRPGEHAGCCVWREGLCSGGAVTFGTLLLSYAGSACGNGEGGVGPSSGAARRRRRHSFFSQYVVRTPGRLDPASLDSRTRCCPPRFIRCGRGFPAGILWSCARRAAFPRADEERMIRKS